MLNEFLSSNQPQLVQSRSHARSERDVGQLCERSFAGPQLDRITPSVRPALPGLVNQLLKTQHVHVCARELIPGWAGLDQAPGTAKRPSQRRNMDLDRCSRRNRGILAPQPFDQLGKLRYMATMHSELRQDRLLLYAGQMDQIAIYFDDDRTEQTDHQPGITITDISRGPAIQRSYP
jgi:hypothetical protein